MDAEMKRRQAKGHTGVSYDARSDRFTAEIWVEGRRRWLGSYHTVVEASDAYQAAKAERPQREQKPNAFMQAYAAFRDRHGGDRQEPPEGAELVYDGQAFVFAGTTWRNVKGRGRFAFMVWRSKCKTCGAEYSTMTPSPVSVAKGVTRNCQEHVGERPFGRRSPPRAKVQAKAEPLTLREELAVHLTALGRVHERLPIERVAELIAERSARFSDPAPVRNSLQAWAAGRLSTDVVCPVELRGGEVVFPDDPVRGLL